MKKGYRLSAILLAVIFSASGLYGCVGGNNPPAHTHTYGAWTTTPATCTEDGKRERVCADDPTHIETEKLDPLGHDLPAWTLVPTCTGGTEEERVCRRDGCTYKEEQTLEVDPAAHALGDWLVALHDKCDIDGVEIKVCSHDNTHNTTRLIECKGHIWQNGADKDGWLKYRDLSCETDEEYRKYCQTCKFNDYKITKEATGHDFEESVILEPTCDSYGTLRLSCKNCHVVREEQILNDVPHNIPTYTATIPATCSTDGSRQGRCETCRQTITETLKAIGHDYTYTTVTSPTCTAKGSESGICANCGGTTIRTLYATGHSYTYQVTTPPTCQSAGIETGTCSNCHATTTRATEKAPHTVPTWTVSTPATCTQKGTEEGECIECEGTVYRQIDQKDHTYGNWSQYDSPTCTEKGVDRRYCTACNHFESRVGADKMPHTYGAWKNETPSTCSTAGVDIRECGYCDDYEERDAELIPNNHIFDDWFMLVYPTCTEDGGIEARLCTENPLHAETRYTNAEALGHNLTNFHIITPATNNTNGEKEGTCSRCGHKEVVVIPMSGTLGLEFTLNEDGTGYIVSKGKGIMLTDTTKLYIPEYHNDLPVVEIAEKAFYDFGLVGANTLRYVTIPGTVKYIGKEAFYSCDYLQQVIMKSGVEVIGESAFSSCDLLFSVTIADTVTTIGKYAFTNCGNLTSITVPASVTLIDDYVFANCAKLTTVVLNEGLEKIANYAFGYSYKITNLAIPKSVTEIGYAFSYWTANQTLYIPHYNSQSEASAAWGYNYRTGCNAIIVYGEYPPTAN